MAGLLLLGGIFCNDMEEIGKIPSLVGHYIEHQQKENVDFDFIDYLVLHYSTDHQQSSDNPDLPFYHHNCPSLIFTEVTPFEVDLAMHASYTVHQSIYSVNFSEVPSKFFLKPPKS